MKNFAEKIRSLLFNSRTSVQPDNTPFDFIKTRKGILKELYVSKQSRNLVGVYSPALGEGMFLVAVEDVEAHNKEEIIVFQRYDMSGHILTRTHVSIDEIDMVCPFDKKYNHPLLHAEKLEARYF
jgi:hypothetical protein